jgi:hypothetical protein
MFGCDSGRNSLNLKNCSLQCKIIRPKKMLKYCCKALRLKTTQYVVLIPYVKRLLQQFPEIKEKTKRAFLSDRTRNRFHQFETRRCVERIGQTPLEFN